MGAAHTLAWDPGISPLRQGCCTKIPPAVPSSPQTCLGSVRAISSPPSSFLSAPKTQQIPWGPGGSPVRGGSGVGVVVVQETSQPL